MLYEKFQIGRIHTFIDGSRDLDAPTLFQVASVDSGEIRWIHGVEMTKIFSEHRKTVINPF